ncbi:hypothetical protein JCM11251_001720 [Rhodosporidiobolus azoricus]
MTRSPLIAQDLPYDVLLEIFGWLAYTSSERIAEELLEWPHTAVDPTYRSLALVCRNWRDAGQTWVFKSIVFSTTEQCRLWLRTATERPDLAAQVRVASVGRLDPYPVPDEGSREDGEWEELSNLMLDCLAECKQLHHLHVAPLHYPTAFRVFEVIRSQPIPLHSLILRLFDAHHDVPPQACIDFYLSVFDLYDRLPLFTHFEINFRPPYLPTRDDLYLPVLPVSSVTSFHSTVNSVEAFLQALRMMPALKILNVYSEWAFEPNEATAVFGALTHLEELRVESNVPSTLATATGQGGNPSGQENMWLNALLPKYAKLRKLSVTEQDALPQQFVEPPPSLELLEFIHFGARPDLRFFDFEDLLEQEREPSSRFCAVEFIFVADEEAFARNVSPDDVNRVNQLYADKGVRFRVEHEIMELPEKKIVEL